VEIDVATVKLLVSNSLRGALDELAPVFERETGHTLDASFDPAQVMLRRIAGGESGDVAILGKAAIDRLADQGKIEPASRRTISRCGVGVAVRSGAAKPDIGSLDAFRRALLDAKSIAHTTEGASGMHFSKVIEQLGIAREVQAKARTQPGGLVAELVVKGEAELAIQQVPELMAVKGADLVDPLPKEVQAISTSTAGIFTDARNGEAGRALIDFLVSPAAVRVLRARGLDPA
jgi:molybdate transport system substrate-binding protein